MSGKTLEKATIVPDEDGRGHRLVLSWLTGGSGRDAEMLPEIFPSRAAANERVLADYGVGADPPDLSIDRRP